MYRDSTEPMGYLGEGPAPTYFPSYVSTALNDAVCPSPTKLRTTPADLLLDAGSPTNEDYFGRSALPDNVIDIWPVRQKAETKARLRMLRHLPADHDGEGAAAPLPHSVDAAISFVSMIVTDLTYGPTLNDDGQAVIEFEDRAAGRFADIAFHGDQDNTVDCYRRQRGEPSVMISGKLDQADVATFLMEAGIIA